MTSFTGAVSSNGSNSVTPKVHYPNPTWNGRAFHRGQSHLLSLLIVGVQIFMLKFGYSLMIGALVGGPALLTGAIVIATTLYFMARTFKNIGVNEIDDAMQRIFKLSNTDETKINVISVPDTERYPPLKFDQLKNHHLLLMKDKKGKTTRYVVTFRQIREKHPDGTDLDDTEEKKRWITYVIGREFNMRFHTRNCQTEGQTQYPWTIHYVDALPASKWRFLKDLLKKTFLPSNGINSYKL